ncbi:Arginyl-tRNA--protein transferase 1 [Rhodotorula kratochvilovae]
MATSASSVAESSASASTHDDHEPLSFLQPLGYSASSCGYCAEVKGARSRSKSSKSYGCWAHTLSAATYKALIDRGWRRSGCYLYKPDLARTCCPQFTIALDAAAFTPSRSQRQVLQRFAAYTCQGEREGHPGWGPPPAEGTAAASAAGDAEMKDAAAKSKKKDKGMGKAEAADWGEAVHSGDWDRSSGEQPFKHRFEYIVEPASFTEEKYALFKRYQMEVHNEPASKVSAKGFRRFLVDTPLEIEPTHSPAYFYGSHHALYRLDGRLIAFAVLDLLPHAVSSVYFVWDPSWAGMSLGKISALREAQMVREMEAAGAWDGAGGRYMMGYYIHTCPKMRYKADYQPSFLLDPDANTFVPFAQCKPLLDSGARITSFSAPLPRPASASAPEPAASSVASVSAPLATEADGAPAASGSGSDSPASSDGDDGDGDDDVSFPSPPPPGCLDPSALPKDLLLSSLALERRTLMPLLLSEAWHDRAMQQEVRELLACTGEELAGRVAVFMGM